MTVLLRKIASLEPWLAAPDLAALSGDPPIWAIREFMPSEKDGSGLSVYELDDASDAERIAAAWAMVHNTPAKLRVAFAVVDRVEVERAELRVETLLGTLNHNFSDSQHRDLILEDHGAVLAATSAFMKGEMISFEARTVYKALEREVRADGFRTVPIAKIGVSSMAAKNLLKFIGDEICEVRGRAA